MSRGRAWTPQEQKRLESMAKDKVRVPLIARRLGKTVSAIQSRLVKCRIPATWKDRGNDT